MEIAAVAAAFTLVTEGCKTVRAIIDGGGKSDELKEALARVQGNLLKLQVDAMAGLEEKQTLIEQLRELQHRLDVRDRLQLAKNMYWLGAPEDGNGPYCVPCYDGDECLRRLLTEGEVYYCTSCGLSLTMEGRTTTPRQRQTIAANLPQHRR